jgi:iron complex transport system substrate-binding protein
MGQHASPSKTPIIAGMIAISLLISCGNPDTNSVPGAEPRVASATPAGTDLLVGIGAADHLVAVSNFDDDREGIIGKPRIGDYQTIDWEKLASVHPQILLIQEASNRVTDAINQRSEDLGIRLINLKIDTIQDIYDEMALLAQAVGQTDDGKRAVLQIQSQLAAVRAAVAGKPAIKTLIVTDDSGMDIAGPNTFLDELLTIAGGQNVAANLGKRYASLDQETLVAMAPDVVIQLLPDGDKTPQVMAQAAQFWTSLPNLPAVKNHRVYTVTDWYGLLPGVHVGDLAVKFAHLLHPEINP